MGVGGGSDTITITIIQGLMNVEYKQCILRICFYQTALYG